MRSLIKAVLLLSLTTFSLKSFSAVNLTCEMYENKSTDSHFTVIGQTLLNCRDSKGESYTLVFRGIGLGLRKAPKQIIVLTCPTVSKKKLNRKGKVELFGVKVAASLGVGVNAVAAINHKGGTCLAAGLEMGAGASVTTGQMIILKGTDHEDKLLYDWKSEDFN